MEIIEPVGKNFTKEIRNLKSLSCKFLCASFQNQMDNLVYWLVILRVAYRRTIILSSE